jgi:hypothetical protein
MAENTAHTHHDEKHAAIEHNEIPGYYEILEISIRELLIAKGLITADEHRHQLEVLDSRSPALGSMIIARAWMDAEYRVRLLANGNSAAEELGISNYDDSELRVIENTDSVHNFVVCTLCSCYPRTILGLAPDWYKSKQYRSRAVREPRAVLAEFGTVIPDNVEVVVHDATSMIRYLILPKRPAGTESFSAEQLAALVTRDTMIGVTVPRVRA